MKRIIVKPVLTEKSMRLASMNQYVFEVDRKANKKEIMGEINNLFGVNVTIVRMHLRPGKTKRLLRQRKTVKSPMRKYAIVTLQKGQKIDGFDQELEIEENES